MVVTAPVSHESMGWLNAKAAVNMRNMVATEPVSHEERGWSNRRASENMKDMSVTELVSHESRGWLNDEALLNMPSMVVTELVSQALMSSVKFAAAALQQIPSLTQSDPSGYACLLPSCAQAQKSQAMSVIEPVFQLEMWP